jgi:MoaA/NifB/PqqE/SkfB family radical SAM enzyme
MIEKKLALMLGYECNNNCIFCYAGDKKKFSSMTTKHAMEELENGIDIGCKIVDFNGGEPTIRKDIFKLLEYAKIIGYKTISMTTNGRMLYYPEFVDKLIESGLNSIIISLHGHNSKLHDYLTGVNGSFDQTVTGLKNLKKKYPHVHVCTNTVITKINYMFLPQIAENNIRSGADACEFIFVHPRGNAMKNFNEVVPSLKETSEFIPETLNIGKKYDIDHFFMRYFPLCYMKGCEEHLSELDALDKLKEHHVGPEFHDLNVENGRKTYGRLKGPQCSSCKYDSKCEGIFKEIAERRGFGELVIC